nr:B271 [uncultured bacterium]ART36425.1 C412 [uncultured bacterium]ART39658.1 J231 [uncultured bacterium]ART40049.1 K264 [uncultured bacterium]ART40936.1 L617 [uncultured bacterium]
MKKADKAAHVLIGGGMHFEEFALGYCFRTRGRTVTEADLVNFVNLAWFTEELFTNTEDREGMLLKGRVVPGALVYSFAEGLLMPSMQDTGMAFLGAEIKIPASTCVGDTIHVECEVIMVRPSSKPGRGVVQTMNQVVNQKGEVVLTYNPTRLIKAKS